MFPYAPLWISGVVDEWCCGLVVLWIGGVSGVRAVPMFCLCF